MLSPNKHPQRPALVWVISGLIVLSILGTNLYLLLHLTGIDANREIAVRLEPMTAVDYARRIVFGVLELAAATSLFLLRKLAVHLFLGLLVLLIAFVLYSLAIGALAPQYFLTIVVGGLIAFGLPLWYTLGLKKRGLLR